MEIHSGWFFKVHQLAYVLRGITMDCFAPVIPAWSTKEMPVDIFALLIVDSPRYYTSNHDEGNSSCNDWDVCEYYQ